MHSGTTDRESVHTTSEFPKKHSTRSQSDSCVSKHVSFVCSITNIVGNLKYVDGGLDILQRCKNYQRKMDNYLKDRSYS